METALLHDTVEDTSAKPEEVRATFGEDVARCVDGVTKLSKISLANREDRQAESLRKMLLAMTADIRVIIVKLADRLHNMRTIGALPRERQEAIAQETLEIYAPIAHRLGMGKLRSRRSIPKRRPSCTGKSHPSSRITRNGSKTSRGTSLKSWPPKISPHALKDA
jgi:GTP pyrophosphokinase